MAGSSLSKSLRSWTLNFIQQLFHLWQTVSALFALFNYWCWLLYQAIQTSGNANQQVVTLMKLPKHVVLCCEPCRDDEDVEVFLRRVARILSWCIDAGISNITVFDNSGVAKASYKKLELETVTNLIKQSYTLFPLNRRVFASPFQPQDVKVAIPTQLDVLEGAGVKVVVLSEEDGHGDVVRFAREFVRHAPASVDFTDINKSLTSNAGNLPSVELAIFCSSKNRGQAGLPPFLLKAAEIADMRPIFGQWISHVQFIRCLIKYAGSEQRWGR